MTPRARAAGDGRRVATAEERTQERRHDEQGRDAEAADEVRERRDVVERVLDERERDAVEQRGEHERGFGCETARRSASARGGASAGPAVGDRQSAVLAERLGRHAHAGRCLAALVLVAVDEARDPAHRLGIEALRPRAPSIDRSPSHVALDDRVEHVRTRAASRSPSDRVATPRSAACRARPRESARVLRVRCGRAPARTRASSGRP